MGYENVRTRQRDPTKYFSLRKGFVVSKFSRNKMISVFNVSALLTISDFFFLRTSFCALLTARYAECGSRKKKLFTFIVIFETNSKVDNSLSVLKMWGNASECESSTQIMKRN